MNLEREAYMRAQQAEHDMYRMRNPEHAAQSARKHAMQTLAHYQTFPTRLAEAQYANTLASLQAMEPKDMLRLVGEAINHERFANYDTRWTDMSDRGLRHMLGEAERVTKEWAL